MYYDKEIYLYKPLKVKDEVSHTKVTKLSLVNEEPYLVDVQPSNAEKVKKDYGYDIECDAVIYCDIMDIAEGDVIKYNDSTFRVQKVPLPWDDYMIVFMSKETVELD